MGKERLQHVMMPTLLGARSEMIQSDLSFRFFQRRLYGPAHPGEAGQFLLGTIGRCVAQVKLAFWLRAERATEDRPAAWTGQLLAYRSHSQKGQLDDQRTFAAFLDLSSLPAVSAQTRPIIEFGRKVQGVERRWSTSSVFELFIILRSQSLSKHLDAR